MIVPLLHADKLFFYQAEISSWEPATVVIVSHNMAERSAILGAAESVIPGGRGRGRGAPQLYSRVTMNQRYTEITHDQLLFSIAQRICLTVHRETLTQYITTVGPTLDTVGRSRAASAAAGAAGIRRS